MEAKTIIAYVILRKWKCHRKRLTRLDAAENNRRGKSVLRHGAYYECKYDLSPLLAQLMRFKFGEVYTVSVSPFFGVAAPSAKDIVSGDIALGFSCDPANSRGLIQAALEEICKLQVRTLKPNIR